MRWTAALAVLLTLAGWAAVAPAADQTSTKFTGRAVTEGTVTASPQNGKTMLTLSGDFVVPGSPDPHWQVVDANGAVYLLDRLKLKDDRIKTSIVVPAYVPSVAKVQMWCSWAEVVLGEASFSAPVMAAR
jgi:hypothetical protein